MLDFLFQRSNIFTPIESKVLDSLCAALPPPYQHLAREQLRLYTLAQRSARGKCINLFQQKLFLTRDIPERLALPQLADEYRLGRVILKTNQSEVLNADVWILLGRIFSIHFNQSPAKAASAEEVQTVLFVDFDKKMLVPVLDVDPPLDYIELISRQTSELNGWRLYDLNRQLKEIVLDEHNYFALAFKEQTGFVGIRSSDRSGVVDFVDYESDAITSLESSFSEFIQSH